MGGCFGKPDDEEIENAKTIDDLLKIFETRKNDLIVEIGELKDFLVDKKKIPTKISVREFTDEQIQLRITYLEKGLVIAYEYTSKLLHDYGNKLVVNDELKRHLKYICQNYFPLCDEEGRLQQDTNTFKDYVSVKAV